VLVTTIGLALHSVADGASMFLSDKTNSAQGLGLLIFLAILLHKAPASIGFGTFLYHEGLRNCAVVKHLLAFTISCPLVAIITYFGLLGMDVEGNEKGLMFWVGILLLISAGSFLYVATIHILPEVFCNTDVHRPHTHHHLPEDHVHDDQHYPKAIELVVIIMGLYTPFIITSIFGDAD
jgi:zinc transporter 9